MKFDYGNLIQNIFDGLYLVDLDRKIHFWNKAAERITGFSAEEVVGHRCMDNILIHVDDKGHNLCLGMCPLAEAINDNTVRETEVYLHHKDGHRVPVWVRTSPLSDENGTIVGGAELFTDMSSKNAIQMKIYELEKLAYKDTLTNLANRRYIELELDGRIAEMRRYGLTFGILLMDIDHFKFFNDTYGHGTGDLILKAISNTLMSNARPFDIFGRWGGEEFIGLIRQVDMSDLIKIADRFRVLIEKTQIQSSESKLNITVSIGAALAQTSDSAQSLIKRADELLYMSKEKGRNRISINLDD